MRTRLAAFVVMVMVLATAGIATAGSDREFRARLSGDKEVPDAVDTETRGRFKIEFNKDETEAEYRLRIRHGVRVTQAHIHCAPEGENGPIVAFLAGFHAAGWDVDGKWISNAILTDENVRIPQNATPSATCPNTINDLSDLAEAMRDGNTYVNVHTSANPGGEIRGQIIGKNDD